MTQHFFDRRHLYALLALTTALGSPACSSDRQPKVTLTPGRDAGTSQIPDTGVAPDDGGGSIVPDSGTMVCGDGTCDPNETNATCAQDCPSVPDAGAPDAGTSDAGMSICGNGICDPGETFISCPADCRPPVACSPGEEGCECNSTWIDGDPSFFQDDCNASLLCVPWDTLSGRQDLTGPLQSCVRPCAVNSDCGAGRSCVDSFGFEPTTGIGRICVDRLAAADQYCGTSKLTIPRIAGVTIETGNEQIGCAAGVTCSFGILQTLHPDEGVCLQFCGRVGDPPCAAPTPYCNPRLFTETDANGNTIDVGVCSIGQLGVGAWCSPSIVGTAGLTQICDTSAAASGDVRCVGLGVTYGMCMELCDTTATPQVLCQGVDPNAGALYCVDGLLAGGGGICMTPGCDSFPDSCAGAGGAGLGEFCFALTMAGDGICADRRGPSLSATEIGSNGALATMGGDCQATDMGFTECPESTQCIGLQGGTGGCIIGCSPADATYCTGELTTLGLGTINATCAAVFQDPMNGVCGGD